MKRLIVGKSCVTANLLFCRAAYSLIPGGAKAAFSHQSYTLPDLPYAYNALEPVISAQIMELHHSKHHQAYVTNLNNALTEFEEAKLKGDLKKQVTLQAAIKFNGGGHLNHSIFWQNLCPPGNATAKPNEPLLSAINADFGSLEALKDLLSKKTLAIQGSGWGWLGYNPTTKHLDIAFTANQDPLEPTTGLVPLLGIDVWEHAYYLQYKNLRADYLKEIWKIINWRDIEDRYAKALQK